MLYTVGTAYAERSLSDNNNPTAGQKDIPRWVREQAGKKYRIQWPDSHHPKHYYRWSVAVSPDGRYLAAGGVNRFIIYDIESRAAIKEFVAHSGPVFALAFSPDGTSLASAGADNVIIIWNVAKDRLIRTIGGQDGPVMQMAFSVDGRFLAVRLDRARLILRKAGEDARQKKEQAPDRVDIWDTTRWRIVQQLTPWSSVSEVRTSGPGIHDIAFAPGGRRLDLSGIDGVKSWTLADWQGSDQFSGQAVMATRQSPNGQWTAMYAHRFELRDRSQRVVHSLTTRDKPGEIYAFEFSPDGQYLAIGGSGGLHLMRIGDPSELGFRSRMKVVALRPVFPPYPIESFMVQQLGFIPGRDLMFTVDRAYNQIQRVYVRFWDTRSWKEVFPSSPPLESRKIIRQTTSRLPTSRDR